MHSERWLPEKVERFDNIKPLEDLLRPLVMMSLIGQIPHVKGVRKTLDRKKEYLETDSENMRPQNRKTWIVQPSNNIRGNGNNLKKTRASSSKSTRKSNGIILSTLSNRTTIEYGEYFVPAIPESLQTKDRQESKASV
ncbi:unnamed protein product [Orchesella dallaii]|uniref:Uncharacterized protein n=1 Tax=Orchesella dallaii TaxID=48710 RepID=A0ABP1RQ38_9HEXA